MLTPYSPLDFIEALARERREQVRIDAHRVGYLRRLVIGVAAASRLMLGRRSRPVPRPA